MNEQAEKMGHEQADIEADKMVQVSEEIKPVCVCCGGLEITDDPYFVQPVCYGCEGCGADFSATHTDGFYDFLYTRRSGRWFLEVINHDADTLTMLAEIKEPKDPKQAPVWDNVKGGFDCEVVRLIDRDPDRCDVCGSDCCECEA